MYANNTMLLIYFTWAFLSFAAAICWARDPPPAPPPPPAEGAGGGGGGAGTPPPPIGGAGGAAGAAGAGGAAGGVGAGGAAGGCGGPGGAAGGDGAAERKISLSNIYLKKFKLFIVVFLKHTSLLQRAVTGHRSVKNAY